MYDACQARMVADNVESTHTLSNAYGVATTVSNAHQNIPPIQN